MISPVPLPADRPRGLRDKLLLSLIAQRSRESVRNRGKAETEISILYLEQLFCFGSASVAETCLKRLRAKHRELGDWIQVTRPAKGARGHHYGLGRRALKNEEQWQKSGDMLFGIGGLLEPYRNRPIFRYGGLGPYGCVVLAFVERFGPVQSGELEGLLSTYMSDSTVRKNLRILRDRHLIKEKRDLLFTGRGLHRAIAQYELEWDLLDDQRRRDRIRTETWVKYQTEVLGEPGIAALKAMLRKWDCFYCEKSPPPGGGEVEHFPPVVWGGSDKHSLLLPICRGCNGKHGRILAGSGRETLSPAGGPTRIVSALSLLDLTQMIVESMFVAAASYATALNDRNVALAKETALARFPLWAAMKGHGGGIQFVDQVSGEINGLASVQAEIDIDVYGGSLKGIPKMLSA